MWSVQHTSLYTCLHTYPYTGLYTCLYASLYTCPYTCVYTCSVHMSIHIFCTHVYTHVHTHVYTHVYTHVQYTGPAKTPDGEPSGSFGPSENPFFSAAQISNPRRDDKSQLKKIPRPGLDDSRRGRGLQRPPRRSIVGMFGKTRSVLAPTTAGRMDQYMDAFMAQAKENKCWCTSPAMALSSFSWVVITRELSGVGVGSVGNKSSIDHRALLTPS